MELTIIALGVACIIVVSVCYIMLTKDEWRL